MNPLSTQKSIAQSEANKEQQRSKRRGGVKYPFPQRLFDLLQDIDVKKPELSHIISWHPNGKYFQLHNRIAFEKFVQKKYFDQSKYASFRRQLNLWGFERIPCDTAEKHEFGGCFFHPLFQRHDRSLCCNMVRGVGRHGSKSSRFVSLSSISTNASSCDDDGLSTDMYIKNPETHNKNKQMEDKDISPSPGAIGSLSLSTFPSLPSSLLVDINLLEPIEIHEGSFLPTKEEMRMHGVPLHNVCNNNEAMVLLGEMLSIEDQQPEQKAATSNKNVNSDRDTSVCSGKSNEQEDYEFHSLINYLSANDEHISKYLFS